MSWVLADHTASHRLHSLIKGRVGVTQSLEYRYVRSELNRAGLPPLERDTRLESFDSFTRVDFKINDRHTAAVNLSFYPQD